MDQLRQYVRRASWCLFRNQLLRNCTWSLLGGLLIALVAVLIPKFWPIQTDPRPWILGWSGGCVLLGLLAGLLWTITQQPTELESALEIDLRYGLHERVSSAVAQSSASRSTDVGQALVHDAAQRLERIDLSERFGPVWNWHPVLPLVTAVIVFLVAVVPSNAVRDQATATADDTTAREQVRESVQELKRRIIERKRSLQESDDLPDADQLLTKFEKAVNDLEKPDVDRKQALVRLNNLSQELAEQRRAWEGGEKTREQLKQLTGLREGPARRVADALQAGDMPRATDALSELGEMLNDEDTEPGERDELASQLEELADDLEPMLGPRQDLAEKQQTLQEQVRRLEQQGDPASAGALQHKLDQLNRQLTELDQQQPQLGPLQELANEMQDSARSIQEGKPREAAEALRQMAQDLQEMQQKITNLELLDSLMQQIASTKNAMQCDRCGGKGCPACQAAEAAMVASSGPRMAGDEPGPAAGEGRGKGERPEEETATTTYRARVGADARPGEAMRAGDASGPNLAGNSREAIKQLFDAAAGEDPDPLGQQQLPRREREQTKEYFELLRQGSQRP